MWTDRPSAVVPGLLHSLYSFGEDGCMGEVGLAGLTLSPGVEFAKKEAKFHQTLLLVSRTVCQQKCLRTEVLLTLT